ncbi:MAG: serine/threonine protein kinase [Pirellulales bacterium]|nr:serine/threonine protein kinase [Pirellulales bacterium]
MSVPDDNDPAIPLLDAYLSRLQAGEKPDPRALLEKHPELASALNCLDALELLAPPSGEGSNEECGTVGPALDSADLPRDFGPYELVREIGRGGMGVVYEARQKGLDRSVAVKMILAGHLASAEIVRRFQTEAKAAARLRHSNIVHIHDVGQHAGQHFFAMEYIEGRGLDKLISAGPLDAQRAVRLISKVARAVDHLHRQGVLHRDLKPSNILTDAEEEPFVTDFGLAKVFASDSQTTATGVIAGTPSYMAPEQASGRRAAVGPAADVYSLGAILYELLTGAPPFRAETPLDTLMEVLSRDPVLPRKLNPRIPRGLELICLKCLSKEPQQRYGSAAALADDLERFARGDALEVRPPNLARRFWGWTRRQPALASRLGALGLFYVIETINYLTGAVDGKFHWQVSLVVALWAAASVACQQLLAHRRWSFPARYAWGVLDSLALLVVMLIARGAASPLVIGYPLIIVGSALWYRVRFVWFMTLLSLLSYGALVLDFYFRRPELQQAMEPGYNRHVIFALGLLILSAIVSYLVQRLRILSSYYGQAV